MTKKKSAPGWESEQPRGGRRNLRSRDVPRLTLWYITSMKSFRKTAPLNRLGGGFFLKKRQEANKDSIGSGQHIPRSLAP